MVNLRTFHILSINFLKITIVKDYFVVYLHLENYKNIMSDLPKTYTLYDKVDEVSSGCGIDIISLSTYFENWKGVEVEHVRVHSHYEIIWFQKGYGVHYVDFNEYPITPNTIYFVTPGQIHAFDEKRNQEGIVLKVCTDLLDEATLEEATFRMFNLFRGNGAPYHLIDDVNASKMAMLIDVLQEEIELNDEIGHTDYMKALLRILVITIERGCREAGQQVLHISKTSHKTFLAFRHLLEDNYHKLHTVKDYATRLNISTKTLTSYITECSTLSPLEIINSRITIEAKRMLKYSNLMVKEIGYMLGFEDSSYFVKFFKRQTGLLPIEFRNNYATGNNTL